MATIPHLGNRLNIVRKPSFPCPACSRIEPIAVHQHGVRWQCGHEQSLPPMPAGRGGRPFHRKKEIAA